MATRSITRIEDATPSSANVDGMMAVVLLAAGAGVLYMLGTPLVLDPRDRDFNPLVVLAGLCGIGAVYYLARSMRRRSVAGRFGTTAFEQEGHDTYVGETLRGRVVTSRPLSAPEGFRLRVRCIERKGESFDETRRRTRDAILWEATRTVHTADSRAGVPVEFLIPPAALAEAKLGSGDWTLKVEAMVDGAHYEATFGLRVYGGTREEDEADDSDDDADDQDEAPLRAR